MKTKFLLLLSLFISSIGCQYNFDRASTQIVLDRYTTQEDLTKIMQQLPCFNMKMNVETVSFNDRGKLRKIKGNVEFGDQGIATFGSDKVGKIIIRKDLNGEGGFSVAVRDRWF